MDTLTQRETVVTITFNGHDKVIAYQPQEQVEAVLNRALNDFQVQQNRHLMSLFNEAGAELNDKSSMAAAGVKPGDVLVLRQSTVKGGGR
jgi:hypothetical protein